jgi:hypothetical protein
MCLPKVFYFAVVWMIITACYHFQTRIFLFFWLAHKHTKIYLGGKNFKTICFLFFFCFFTCSVTKKLYYKVLKWIHLKVRCFKTSNSLEYQMKITKVFWSTWMEMGNIQILLYPSKPLNDFLNEKHRKIESNETWTIKKLGTKIYHNTTKKINLIRSEFQSIFQEHNIAISLPTLILFINLSTLLT